MLYMDVADFLLDGTFPVDTPSGDGRTPLHFAVQHGNVDAVKRLVYQTNASVTINDHRGWPALHHAVYAAAHITDPEGPGEGSRKAFTQIINILLNRGAQVDYKDNSGSTAWLYARGDDNEWIRRIKDKHLIIGSSSTTSRDVEVVRPPLPGAQKRACKSFDMVLAEVFLQKKRDRSDEVFNFDLTSAHDVIYKVSGVSQALTGSRSSRLAGLKVQCRWIHVPSNNEQWIHDLMLSMGIQDSSMAGQRHEGSRLIDRYMMPQARRYKHLYRNVEITDQTQDTPVSKPGKASSLPEVPRTEAEAIVVFVSVSFVPSSCTWLLAGFLTPRQMPILGFERHRQRKFLAQSFSRAERALQMARARDSGSSSNLEPRSKPTTAGFSDGDQQRASETSDEEGSSSGHESSQLYLNGKRVARTYSDAKTHQEALLLSGYLDCEQVKPVHCRRTLDQFSYYMLHSTEARDKNQVTYRWARDPSVCPEPKNRPIVMVDQLWLWVLHDGTVITSSPNTWDGAEDFNLSNVIIKELRHNKDRPIIRSVEDLFHLILKASVDFFRRKGPANCQFHECFQSSINKVSETQGHLFNKFRRTTKKLQLVTLDPAERKKEIEHLFSLDEETELLVEILDIQDELTIVKNVLSQQQDVLSKLLRLYPKKVEEDADEKNESRLPTGLGKSELMILKSLVQLLGDQAAPSAKPTFREALQRGDVSLGNGSATPRDERPQESEVPNKLRLKVKVTEAERPKPPTPIKTSVLQNRDLMYETIGIVENNVRIVADMLAYAAKVESSVCKSRAMAVRPLRGVWLTMIRSSRIFSTSSRNTQTGGRRALPAKARRRHSGRETWVPAQPDCCMPELERDLHSVQIILVFTLVTVVFVCPNLHRLVEEW
jgi:hypothetical protein